MVFFSLPAYRRQRDEEVREAQRARQAYEEGIERATAMMKELAVLREQLLSRYVV